MTANLQQSKPLTEAFLIRGRDRQERVCIGDGVSSGAILRPLKWISQETELPARSLRPGMKSGRLRISSQSTRISRRCEPT